MGWGVQQSIVPMSAPLRYPYNLVAICWLHSLFAFWGYGSLFDSYLFLLGGTNEFSPRGGTNLEVPHPLRSPIFR